MELDKKNKPDRENSQDKVKNWVEKTEEVIDDAAEKIHKSDAYRKVDKSVEKATKSIFRKAGILWGKSEHYIKGRSKKKDNE